MTTTQKIEFRLDVIRRQLKMLNVLLSGKRVRIVSDYNGQPYGSSKPSLKGKIFEIESISFNCWKGGTINLHLKGQRVGVWLEEVEFL